MNDQKRKRGSPPKFTCYDDEMLIKLVREMPGCSWVSIASCMKNKTPKQCRDRWNNYANPDLKHGKWTTEEEIILLQKYNDIGPKWSEMMKCLPGRSSNDIRYQWLKLTNGEDELNQIILAEKLSLQTVQAEPILDPIIIEDSKESKEKEPSIFEFCNPILELNDFDAFNADDLFLIFGFSSF